MIQYMDWKLLKKINIDDYKKILFKQVYNLVVANIWLLRSQLSLLSLQALFSLQLPTKELRSA